MSIYDSKTYNDDLTKVVNHFSSLLSELNNKTVLITGAGGMICSGVVDVLLSCNEVLGTNIVVYAAGRNIEALRERFCKYANDVATGLKLVYYDAIEDVDFDFDVDYIIHGASNSHPKAIHDYPVETMLGNFKGLYNLLKYTKQSGSKNVLFVSSSEVYGIKNDGCPNKEDEYGFIDIMDPRSSYSCAKRAGETLCASFGSEYGVHTNIARPGHVYGPTATKNDTRVGAVFAYKAASGQDIVLKSKGEQVRSYCYVLDCATAIITILLKGKSGNAYNISNANSIISIKELAMLYAEAANVNVVYDLPTDDEIAAFNPMLNSSLDSSKLEGLGWKGMFDARVGTSHTVVILKGE